VARWLQQPPVTGAVRFLGFLLAQHQHPDEPIIPASDGNGQTRPNSSSQRVSNSDKPAVRGSGTSTATPTCSSSGRSFPPPGQVTALLKAWSAGDKAAYDQLFSAVSEELHRITRHYMRREPPGHTLQTTALVNEAYLRLVDVTSVNWQDRAHFFAVTRLSLAGIANASSNRTSELMALDEALDTLERVDPRKVRVIELRFFGGLSVKQTAEVLKISAQSVMRDWKLAKAWVLRELTAQG